MLPWLLLTSLGNPPIQLEIAEHEDMPAGEVELIAEHLSRAITRHTSTPVSRTLTAAALDRVTLWVFAGPKRVRLIAERVGPELVRRRQEINLPMDASAWPEALADLARTLFPRQPPAASPEGIELPTAPPTAAPARAESALPWWFGGTGIALAGAGAFLGVLVAVRPAVPPVLSVGSTPLPPARDDTALLVGSAVLLGLGASAMLAALISAS
ncbi:MAG: hypothetical protein IT384_14910 [Deltaproteobacteria bacterium]|nr:hypothetical protein [Deltaproteobacteria bacterium]